MQGSEETEIKILKWFVDNLEMIQHYRALQSTHHHTMEIHSSSFCSFPTIINIYPLANNFQYSNSNIAATTTITPQLE